MWFPDIRKRPWRDIDLFVLGIMEVINGLSRILSLGMWAAQTDMRYIYWRSQKMIDNRLGKQ